ncbi:MAG TPA: thioredoxin domain-containing protein [candidate division Zixibacteria bacterium]|nr:thioredoxin domain-containing protein [candidate division Zixibacteria bacterium]
MRLIHPLSLVFLSVFLGLLESGCDRAGDSEKLAEVDGTVITRSDVDRAGGKQLQNLRRQLYQLEKQKLDEYIGATLLTQEARRLGISVATLLEREVNSKVLPTTEDEIKAFYEQNKARLPVELDKIRPQVREYLQNQKINARKAQYVDSLRAKAKITSYLEPPPVYRAKVLVKGAPAKGPETAAVTIVKFEDFQCPFCRKIQPVYRELLARYNGKLRLIHKDLPLDSIHPEARQAAEAARCAGAQGKFWEYHDRLYTSAKLSSADLNAYAKELGLDQKAFESCVSGGKFKAAVQEDVNEGAALGITGTPTYFINGREMAGAQPVEAIAAVIDEELAGKK